jgi:hypothetical protein
MTTAAALAATAALGVSAASAVVGQSPAAAPRQSPVAAAGTDRVAQTSSDPGRGPDWAVRSYVSTTGAGCVEAGRVSAGRFGDLGPGNAFREVPVQEGGTCGSLLEEPVVLAINHYPSVDGSAPRTVLFGRARSDVAEIRVSGPDGSQRPVDTGVGGAFVLPVTGALEATDLPVQVTLTDGRRLTYDWR